MDIDHDDHSSSAQIYFQPNGYMKKIPMLSKDKILILSFGSLAVLVVGWAIIGAFRSYSPVPYGDMWNGTLGFFMSAAEGDNTLWWAQHNEHRILLGRLLFWIYFKFFGGANWFLIVFNYFLLSANALLFYKILRTAAATEKPAIGEILLGLFMTAWLFQWMQYENMTWGFQSSFFLAHLLPLCALYWLHKSIAGTHADYHFLIACGFGLASVGTLANGILALPLMTLYALIMRQNLLRIGILLSLSAATLFLYFHNYHAPVKHGSLSQALGENPFGLLQYMLRYMGSPFYYLFGEEEFGKLMANLAALFLIGSSACAAIQSLRQPRESALTLALLFFIFYIGGTALGTGGGRLIFGLNQAFSSRYTTPSLMAWAALLIIYSPTILSALKSRRVLALLPFAVLAFPMIFQQLSALQPKYKVLSNRKTAALALELHVKDEEQIKSVFPVPQTALALAEKASIQNLSVFGEYPFRDAREQLGVSVQQSNLPACQGSLDAVAEIDGDVRFVHVYGWIFDPVRKDSPDMIRFLGNQGNVVGYALTGKPRPDVAKAIDKRALLAGYQGYLLADQMGKKLTLQGEGTTCQMQVKVPVPLFSLASIKLLAADSVTIDSANVLPGNQWVGSDSYKSVIDGMQVYGSHINSDADRGTISLRIKRGDRIFYRSGPTGGQQFIEVAENGLSPAKLPVSKDWALIDFNSSILPNRTFVIKLSDNGSGWGEWSAIAVRKSSN
jgi:hypothetical protein